MGQAVDTQERFENRLRAWLRYWMDRRGIGPTETADLIGKSQGYISHWLAEERGNRGASAYLAYRISRAFGIDPDDLFNSNDRPPERFWRAYVPHKRDETRENVTGPSPTGPEPRRDASRAPPQK